MRMPQVLEHQRLSVWSGWVRLVAMALDLRTQMQKVLSPADALHAQPVPHLGTGVPAVRHGIYPTA